MIKLKHLSLSWMLILSFTSGMLASNLAHAIDNVSGAVQKIKGTAFVKNASGKNKLSTGSKISEGDQITTDKSAEILIRMLDGTVIAVRPNTNITISNYTFKADKDGKSDNFLVRILKGGLRTLTGQIGKRNPSQFKIVTPTSTIGIRGTDFEVAVVEKDTKDAQAGTYNKVFKGQTFMDNGKGKSVEVRENQAAFSPNDALLIAKQFGIMKNVPAVFFNGTFDGLLQGLQQEAFKQIEKELGIAIPQELRNKIIDAAPSMDELGESLNSLKDFF